MQNGQEGFWSWLSGVTDNSVYPVMFLTYLDTILPGLDSGMWRYTLLALASLLLAYLNYRCKCFSFISSLTWTLSQFTLRYSRVLVRLY